MTDKLMPTDAMIKAGRAATIETGHDPVSGETLTAVYLAMEAARPPLSDDKLSGLVETLFSAIAHGDDDHRAWLKEAIDAHFAEQPVPEPRGKGRKEAAIEAQLRVMREALKVCRAVITADALFDYEPDMIECVENIDNILALSTPEGSDR